MRYLTPAIGFFIGLALIFTAHSNAHAQTISIEPQYNANPGYDQGSMFEYVSFDDEATQYVIMGFDTGGNWNGDGCFTNVGPGLGCSDSNILTWKPGNGGPVPYGVYRWIALPAEEYGVICGGGEAPYTTFDECMNNLTTPDSAYWMYIPEATTPTTTPALTDEEVITLMVNIVISAALVGMFLGLWIAFFERPRRW